MKRRGMALIAVCLLMGMMLTSCRRRGYDRFDADLEGIIQVSTSRLSNDRNEPQLTSFVIADQHRIKTCEPFAADAMTVYHVPYGCLESYIDREQNKVLNRLKYVSVTDEKGRPCETPEIMDDIFQQLAQLEHSLLFIKILTVADEWFVCVDLNVNWWDPCGIYYFNPSENRLIQLYEFDNREVQSIHILSVERLHGLR